jgi:hypothetical protein
MKNSLLYLHRSRRENAPSEECDAPFDGLDLFDWVILGKTQTIYKKFSQDTIHIEALENLGKLTS